MPFKTVLTYADGSAGDDGRLAAAVAAGLHFDAHVSVVAAGIEPDMPVGAYSAFGDIGYRADFHERTVEEADALAEKLRTRLEAQGVRFDVSTLVTTPGALSQQFGQRATFVDLVVLAAPGEGRFERMDADAFEGALFQGDGLVLIGTDPMELTARQVMIAWDGGSSALHAVRRANPFLKAADKVEIAVIDGSAEQSESAEALAVMLSRHGLDVSIARIPSDGQAQAQVLRHRQIEIGADLTVMGGFGHSRFREFVLGGVTRDFPGITATPLLVAH